MKVLTIGRRFYLSSSLLLALMTIISAGSLFYNNVLSKSADKIATDPLPGVYRASQLDTLVFQFRGDTWKHLSLSDTAAKSTIESNQQAIKEKSKITFAITRKQLLLHKSRLFSKEPDRFVNVTCI